MAYNGYWRLGDTEIINSVRTSKYVNSAMPTFGLDNCEDCEGLEQALGATAAYGPEERVLPGLVERENLALNPRVAGAVTSGINVPLFAGWLAGTGESGLSMTSAVPAMTAVVRTNIIPNPRATNASLWSSSANLLAGEVMVVGASDGPLLPDGSIMPTYARYVVAAASTAPEYAGYGSAFTGGTTYPAGTTFEASIYVRVNQAGLTTRAIATTQVNNGTQTAYTGQSPIVNLTPGQWTRVSYVFTATAEFNNINPRAYILGSKNAGTIVEVTGAQAVPSATVVTDYFDGTFGPRDVQPGDLRYVHAWAGTANASASTEALTVIPGTTIPATGTPYARRTFTAPKTSGSTGWQATGGAYRNPVTGYTGDRVTVSLWMRYTNPTGSGATSLVTRLRTQGYSPSGATDTQIDGPIVSLNSGVWTRLTTTYTVVNEIISMGWWAYHLAQYVAAAGSTLDIGGLLIERGSATGTYFDGDSIPSTLERESVWVGNRDASASRIMAYDTTQRLLYDDTYRSPVVDRAPWIDTSNPLLDDFYGVYPLDVTGVDDSTRSVSVTELTTDGAVTSLPRAASREMRFDVMLVGRTEAAVTEGLHWLNRALDAVRCNQETLGCTGTELSFFSACPPACDYSDALDTLVEFDRTQPATRRNWVRNPGPYASGAAWAGVDSGGGTVVTNDYQARINFTSTAPVGEFGVSSPNILDPGTGFVQTLPAGTPVSVRVGNVQTNNSNLRIHLRVALTGGSSTTVLTSPVYTGSTFYSISLDGLAMGTFTSIVVELYAEGAQIVSGDYLYGSMFIAETGVSTNGPYFDGFALPFDADVATSVAVWDGTSANASSGLYAAPDPLTLWSLQGGSTAATLRWLAVDGLACRGLNAASVAASGPGASDFTLTRTLTGLIPGQWYRVKATAWRGSSPSSSAVPNRVTMSVRGAQGLSEFVSTTDSRCAGTTNSSPLWFQAKNSVEFLEFTSVGTPSFPSQATIGVTDLLVERASADHNIYQTRFPNDGTLLNGWTPAASTATFTASTYRSEGFNNNGPGAPVTELLGVGTGGSVPSGTTLMSRTIRGLTPGQTYTVNFIGQVGTSMSTATPLTMVLSVDGNTSTSQVLPNISAGLDYPNMSLAFTATAQTHTVRVATGSAVSIPAPARLYFSPTAVFIEQQQQGSPPFPDPAQDYRRTLYQVTALTGPAIQERYDKQVGHMMRVSFGLVAGVPDQYGPLVDAGSALGGSSSPLQQIDCANGQAVRRNLVVNPSFVNTGTIGWGVMTNATVGRDTILPVPYGGAYGRLYFPVTTQSYMAAGMTPTAALMSPVIAGATYTLSAYVRGTGVSVLDASMSIVGFNSSAVAVAQAQESPRTRLTKDWQRISWTFQAPLGSSYVQVFLNARTASGGNLASTDEMHFDAVMLEEGGSMTPYFDGQQPGGTWDGTVGQSTSTWKYSPTTLVDPDCPPLPAPPGPPSIDEDCIDDPTQWVRYTIYIPDTDVPRFSSVMPVVTLRTGSATARQVRMRWYPNPDDLTVMELPACGYDGEVIVSYVPPQSEMVVNAITRTGTAVVDGTPEQPATQLLYGPDGGPMVWPELSCNQGYVFTVDVDSADDVSELDVLLSLGLKV